MASDFYNNSVFWIEVGRIQPNPYQPRRDFDPEALESLAESIRQYGVLQPLVVTRKEIERGDGGITVEYELVAGERRLRAAKLADVSQVPVLIRSAEDSDKMKLELAIIENLQREDLNPIDRALAFQQLAQQFKLKHIEIAKKVGKSREYVSNSLRLLALPENIQQAVASGHITEGHTRPLMMLAERPEAQEELFAEISEKHLTVREAERIARGIATDRARKQDLSPELSKLERELSERFGTRVQIETREKGGKVHIDFFSAEDLQQLLNHAPQQSAEHADTPAEHVAHNGDSAETPKTQSPESEPAVSSAESSPTYDSGTRAEPQQSAERSGAVVTPLSQFTASAIKDEPDEEKREGANESKDAEPITTEVSVSNEQGEREPAETDEAPTPNTQQGTDELARDEDLYSVRNFSV